MAHYIDADCLKAEIESRMEDCKLPDGRFPTKTNIVRYEELLCLLNFIDSLQQEQPQVADASKMERGEEIDDKYIERSLAKVRLEKELAEYLQYWEDDEELGLILTTDTGVIQIELDDIRDLARHFAEWEQTIAARCKMQRLGPYQPCSVV